MSNDELTWFEGEGPSPTSLAGVLGPEGRGALHWRRACSAERCAAIVAAARAGELGPSDARDHADPTQRQVRVYGCAVSPSDTWPAGPDPDHYFATAPDFRARLGALGEESFPDFFLRALGFVAGVPAAVPCGTYGSCTVRHLTRGTALPPHCEHLYAGIEVYRELRELGVDLEGQLSFFVVLEAPRAGGALRVYPGPWRPLLDRLGPPRKNPPDIPPEPAEPPSCRTIEPAVGDMLVFPSGATVHEVTPVVAGERWTIGGFAAFAPSGDRLWCWG